MKKTVLIAAVLCVLISPALGVVGHNDTGGEMGVTSTGSTASGTTAVGPNGTEYSSKVSMEGRTQDNTEDRIREETISSSGAHFNGTIQAATPI
jgi:hypothetical protein